MTTRRAITLTPAVLVTTAALAFGGCSDSSSDDAAAEDRGLDTEQYVETYEAGADDSGGAFTASGSAPAPGSAPGESEIGDPGLLDDNTFVDHGTSGFVDTRQDAQSTFALDVDTGSYTVARTLLEQGVRPPAASIRVEEWVNAFDYGDATPVNADLGVTAETGTAPSLDDGTQLVRVAVTTRDPFEATRPPLNVTLVVDRSGSMDIRERLGLVKSSLAILANRLRDDDTVSVVSFEDQATPILEPTPVSDTDAILGAIDELTPGGSTNLEAGLRLGYEQARQSFAENKLNVVVLCSDGVANVGRTGPDSIVDQIAEEGADGIHLVTVGFGMGNYNDHLMEQLADLGDGFYSYVDTYDEAEQFFGTELTTAMIPMAAEARAQVTFAPAAVASYRLIGYENREIADDDFVNLDVDAGELGAGHHASALYEVRLAEGVEPGDPIGSADVLWTSPADGSAQRAIVSVNAAPEYGSYDAPGLAFELAATVADTAQLLKGAVEISGRELTLDDLEARAQALVEAEVSGAEELLELIEAAEHAEGPWE